MRLVVCGSRGLLVPPLSLCIHTARIYLRNAFYWCLGHINLEPYWIQEIIHGACRDSPDSIADAWGTFEANRRGLNSNDFVFPFPVTREMRAEHGNYAYLLRNTEMAERAARCPAGKGSVLAIWDGTSNGTYDMMTKGQDRNLDLHLIMSYELPSTEEILAG